MTRHAPTARLDERQKQQIRIQKRLNESIGYLELGLNRRAIDCLADLGPLGSFETTVEMIRAEAFRREGCYDEAIGSLVQLVKKTPSPFDRPVWLAMSMCFHDAGDLDSAIQTLGFARGAQVPHLT